MKTFFQMASRILIGLLIALLLLEATLQIGALLVKENAWRAKAHWLTGHVRVLALGDSNTYGLYLPAEQSYPTQLEQQWNAKHPDLPIEMINLGYPGTNSFRLLANLPDILDTFKPDLVLLMIGFNDFWTPVENIAALRTPSWTEKILYHSRVYKLGYMLWQNYVAKQQVASTTVDTGERMLGGLSGVNLSAAETRSIEQETGIALADIESGKIDIANNPQLKTKLETALQHVMDERKKNGAKPDILNTVKVGDKTFSLGIADGAMAGNSRQMETNLMSMLDLLHAHNTPYFLLNYPSNHSYYPAANRKIQKVAEQTHSRFIGLDNTFTPECRNQPETCPELFFYDGHATAKGNAAVSATVLQALDNYFGVTSTSPAP
jgi:lysophospholipase L1-like esterase